MKVIHVLKNPRPTVHAEIREYDVASVPVVPIGWEQMTEAEFAEWLSAQPPLVQPEPPQEQWRVSKDTIISRVLAAGKLPEVMAALASQSTEQQFLWNNSLWFWSTNATLRGLCTVLEMNPDEILARDPFPFLF